MTSRFQEGGGLFGDSPLRRQIEEQRQAGFEETAVKRILERAGLKLNLAAAREEALRLYRSRELSFHWLRATYPRFPVRLSASKLPHIHEIGVSRLFDDFTKLPFFGEYRKFIAAEDIDDQATHAGLVFNWPHVGTMVMHNYPVQAEQGHDPDSGRGRGTRIVRGYGNPLVLYIIERLSDFTGGLGVDWTTE